MFISGVVFALVALTTTILDLLLDYKRSNGVGSTAVPCSETQPTERVSLAALSSANVARIGPCSICGGCGGGRGGCQHAT